MQQNSTTERFNDRKLPDIYLKFKTDLREAQKAIDRTGILKKIKSVLGSPQTPELLTPKNTELGLLLINAEQNFRSKITHWSHHDEVTYADKRYLRIEELLGTSQWDNESNYNLLVYFLGTEKASYARYAWQRIPFQMYQTGYMRRSYRSPGNPVMYLANQINFIIGLIGQAYTSSYDSRYQLVYTYYDLTLPEQIKFNHALASSNPCLFRLWSAAIDMGNTTVFTQLEDIIFNKDPEGKVTRDILKALLNSEKQEAWVLVEKLLLAAERQEGLRQTILEALDETSIGALKFMIRVIIEHKLSRFSSVVRAVDVWAGLGWESEREATVKSFLEKALLFLENPDQIATAVQSENNADVYMALWAKGVYNVEETIPYLEQLYRTGDVQKRTLALLFAEQTGHYKITMPMYMPALEDKDLQPMACAIRFIYGTVSAADNYKFYNIHYPGLFDKLNSIYKEITIKEKTFESFVFSWMKVHFEKKCILQTMICLVAESQERLDIVVDYFSDMDAAVKSQLSRKILPEFTAYNYRPGNKKTKELTAFQRRYAMMLLKDRSEYNVAFNALYDTAFNPDEWAVFPDLLKRKAAGFRTNVISLLLRQKDEAVAGTMTELLSQGDPEQRLAGLDILLQLKKDRRLMKESGLLIQTFQQRKTITTKEEILLSQLTESTLTADVSPENGYGLFNPANLSVPALPPIDPAGTYEQFLKKNTYAFSMPLSQAKQALLELEKILIENKAYEYDIEHWDNSKTTVLLGNTFSPKHRHKNFASKQEEFDDYPLANLWQEWYQRSRLTTSDLGLILLACSPVRSGFSKVLSGQYPSHQELIPESFRNLSVYQSPLPQILQALTKIYPFNESDAFFIGAATRLFHSLDKNTLKHKKATNEYYYHSAGTGWQDDMEMNSFLRAVNIITTNDEHILSCWQLYHWRQYSGLEENINASIPPLIVFCRAFKLGIINSDEMVRGMLTNDNLRILSGHTLNKNEYDYFTTFPFLTEMFDRVRDHLLNIELKRGDSPTPVTALVSGLRSIYGINRFAGIIAGLGKTTLHKGYYYFGGREERNKQESFSSLLKICFPAATDTQELFNESMRKIAASETRLIEAAMYAPQWQKLVSGYLGWKGLDAAIWWMHAHTKTDAWTAQNAEAESEIARYSSLDVQEFKLGAVDKEWFLLAYKQIKDKWPMVYDAAKYISDGNGHRRARIYADVLLGNINLKDVSEKVKSKRDQDYLRIYGLVPLNKSNKHKDILARYEYLQQFKKESRQFGAQKQTSEAAALTVAMENLARNAGYPDPVRLTWAMETKQVQTILSMETQVKYDDVLIGLVIDEEGQADVVAFKDDKQLKAIPAKYKKDKKVEELNGYRKTLREQFKRSKKGLEEAMVRGDIFESTEIESLFTHPVISKHLEKLVIITEGREATALGFYKDGLLVDAHNKQITLNANDTLRIAHCTDLFKTSAWADYQHFAFNNKLQQPFKQLFRELYLPTEDELKEKSVSRRYAGHQIQPKQTAALLKSRGWKVNYEEGLQKVFHKQGFSAQMYAMADWFSPAEVESPTLETVVFSDLKTGQNVDFSLIDARIFSEVMRDIDLVVSVAHAGAVDPEASHSSIEMRSVLLKETMRLFKINNVEIGGNHARIKGKQGEYSVHLGSAVVHQLGVGYLSILPVHSQHRGRLFLPFVDDDPKSAELISKVLLLARDEQIQDPTILRQLGAQ